MLIVLQENGVHCGSLLEIGVGRERAGEEMASNSELGIDIEYFMT